MTAKKSKGRITVFQPGTSKVWHYRFQVAGVRVQKSTLLTGKGAAEVVAEEAYAAALARANGGEPMPTLDQLFGQWLDINGPVVSDHHLRSISATRRLHLYHLGKLRIDDLTTEQVERARNLHLVDHAPASANHWLRDIKLVVNWAVKRGVLPALPWKVKQLKVQKRPRAMLPVATAFQWLAAVDLAARRPAVGTAIRLMFGLGLREGEAISAEWNWFDWERRTYTPGKTKGREAEPIPVPDWLANYLLPLRQVRGLVAGVDGAPLPTGFARRPMRRANAVCELANVTPHRLRGTFATLLSEQGVPIQDIQKVMRHKDWTTTMGYLETDLGRAAAGQEKIAEKMQNGGAKVARHAKVTQAVQETTDDS